LRKAKRQPADNDRGAGRLHGERPGIEAQKRKQKEFFDLTGRFRGATDPHEVKRLGNNWAAWFFA
jgi:hypothetical protein